MLVASSPWTYAASPAVSHTRFKPREMNSLRSRASEHDDAKRASTYAFGFATRRRSSAAESTRSTRGGGVASGDTCREEDASFVVSPERRFPSPSFSSADDPPSPRAAASTRMVSCLADRVKNALPPTSAGAWVGGPLAPFPAGHGTASARAAPARTTKKASAASPSAYRRPRDASRSTSSQHESRSGRWRIRRDAGEGRARGADAEEPGGAGPGRRRRRGARGGGTGRRTLLRSLSRSDRRTLLRSLSRSDRRTLGLHALGLHALVLGDEPDGVSAGAPRQAQEIHRHEVRHPPQPRHRLLQITPQRPGMALDEREELILADSNQPRPALHRDARHPAGRVIQHVHVPHGLALAQHVGQKRRTQPTTRGRRRSSTRRLGRFRRGGLPRTLSEREPRAEGVGP